MPVSSDNKLTSSSGLMASFDIIVRVVNEKDNRVYFESTKENQVAVRSFVKFDSPQLGNMLFPDLTLSFIATKQQKLLIHRNKNDLIFYVEINIREYSNSEANEGNTGSIEVGTKPWFKGAFQGIIVNKDPVDFMNEETDWYKPDETSDSAEEDSDAIETDAPSFEDRNEMIHVKLSNIAHRNRFKKMINFNMINATPIEALAYGIQTAVNGNNQVILQQPENEKQYVQITSPVWSLKDFVYHMQTVYGLYKSGVIIYQDVDMLYIIPKVSTNYAVKANDYNQVHIHFIDLTDGITSNVNSYEKDTKSGRYIITTTDKFKLVNNSEYNKEVFGNKFSTFDKTSGDNSVYLTSSGELGGQSPLRNYDAKIKGTTAYADDKRKFFHNELNNSYLISEKIIETRLLTKMCTFTVTFCDPSIFTYNKIYKLIFDTNDKYENQHGGYYKLINITTIISAENSRDSLATCRVLMAKIPFMSDL